MRTHRADRYARTKSLLDFVDITGEVQEVLEGSGITEGRMTVMCADGSCRLILQEWESGFRHDLATALQRIEAGTLDARAAVIGSASVVLPVAAGRLRLGTWQRLQLVELEDGSDRKVSVQIVGE